jgi:Tol biopolymer transport system component
MTDAGNHANPRWSPDGKWLAFFSRRSGSTKLWRANADGSHPELLFDAVSYAARWSPDGKWIYCLRVGEESTDVWAVAVDGQAERPMTDLRGRRGSFGEMQGALAADSEYLYFIWQEDLGDIWVADVTYPRLWH